MKVQLALLSDSVIQKGWTSLMAASYDGYGDIVRVLLEAKADPNITDEVKVRYMQPLAVFTIVTHINLMHYVAE